MTVHLSVAVPSELVNAISAAVVSDLAERMGEPTEPWFDVDAAATYLACSRKRIYDLVSQRRLRPAREGRRLLFRREWLDAVVEVDDSDHNVPESG